ncbi:Signal transduction histidine kinase [Pedococcus dokdonensis]|uniref:histidine kinase n=1 Tax=Pedococcus dokdonensis TaxID=443156 RepID=A0A1H0US33_9MICO|nr:sensor histidine kinase [Pedococcus dokdonensis]SDP68961.1 Signal transduction histidine kinase [Pedococcus dokdonensis]
MSRLQSAAGRVPQRWSFGHWPLRRKLAAAIVLPVLLAFVFGGLRVKNDFDSSRQLSQAADTVLVIRPVVDYNLAVQRLAAAGSVGGGGVIAAITKYESAAADLRIALKTEGVPQSVKESGQDALALGQAVRTAKTQSPFSDIVIDKSGNIATLMSSAVSDLGLSDDSASAKIVVALQDAIAAQRAMTGEQLNLSNTDDAAANLRAIGSVGAETAALTRLLSTAPTDQVGQSRQLLNENGRRNYTLQQQPPDKDQIAGLGIVFESSNTGYSKLMDAQLTSLETNLRQRAADHRSDAILNAAIVAIALAVALILVLALMRSLLIPIRAVRQGALDVANNRLPEAVAAMRDGDELPEFVPIPVHTTEEMGQLARAVDDLHTQARTLAGDQARLRVQVGHMFETLSRRSTSLIDQQLSLIERLESDEEDPKRLQSLFRLDHLAARMRRNSDSLLVLAGTSTRRGMSGSVSVSDAVRAAVSEVENYERIDIGDTSNDHVLGAVGSDLIHLVAEIVDNALSYSPPTSRVSIRGARTPEGGLLIEVSDRGLGMPPKELAALNDQLAHGGDITADTARRMGLFVVGSLAKRHGIAVRLRRNGDDKQGVTVSVHLPAGLLADSSKGERPVRPAAAAAAAAPEAAAPAPTTPTSAVGGVTKAGLPTRVRGASGATPSPVTDSAKKLPTRTPGAHGPGAADAIQAPAKPVIEGAEPAEAKAGTNGHTEDQKVNGKAAKADQAAVEAAAVEAPVNGVAADQAKDAKADKSEARSEDKVEAKSDKADAKADAKSDKADAKSEAKADKAEAKSEAKADKAEAKAEAKADDTVAAKVDDKADAKTDAKTEDKAEAPQAEAVEPQRSAAGLPVRKPRATGITEYREFEDAPSTEPKDETPGKVAARSDAPAAKGGRLSWLPGRKAAAEAARLEAEAANEPRQMPSNLSAWLDHRAKLVEAAKARELGADAATEEAAADAPAADATPGTDTTTDASTDASTEIHVPAEWVAEAEAQAQPQVAEPVAETEVAAPVDSTQVLEAPAAEPAAGLPTRVPGATASATAGIQEPEAPTGRPRVRAHNTSFFGARRARDAAPVEPVAEEAPAEQVVVEEPSAVVEPETVAPAAEVTQVPEVTEVTEVPTEVAATVEHAEPEAEHAEPEHAAPVAEVDVVADGEPTEAPSGNLNDTPIFRAMMSRWLTDDTGASAEATSWSTNEADQAWSAAARIEETQPLEESAAGLPKRRPGNYLVPGAVDETDEKPAAPAASRRDPEAIRRNLNRHKNGVSSARTEAQDGTHREEADVHH